MSLLEAYKKNDPAARSLLEVALLYPGVKAIVEPQSAGELPATRPAEQGKRK